MILHHDTSSLRRWPEGPDGCYIASSPALEALLLDRDRTGVAWSAACGRAVADLLGHVADEIVSAAELMLLSKGLVYGLQDQARRLGISLPVNLISTSRVAVEGDQATVRVGYRSIATPSRTLLIGDTIASGSSICAALDAYAEGRPLEGVVVVSLAAASVGVRAIADYCARRDIELSVVMGLAAFGLAPNGFDLSFVDPSTDCAAHLRERATRAFHGRPVSAVGWDFGCQSIAEDKYRALCWVERHYWGLDDTDALQAARRPRRRDEIEHEYAAYRDRLADIDALVDPDAQA